MSADRFDGVDRALASGLSALAPDVEGGDEALAALRPRFQRALTRARVVRIGGTLLAVVVIGTAATLAAPRSTRSHVSVSSVSSTPATGRSVRSSTTSTSTTSAPGASANSTPSSFSSPTTARRQNPSATTPATAPTNGSDPAGGGSGTSGGGDGQHGSGQTTTTTTPANGVYAFRSQGGSVTVRFSHASLKLLGVSPANGYQAEVQSNQPDDIDVRFTDSHGEWRIRVRVDHQGHLLHEIDHS